MFYNDRFDCIAEGKNYNSLENANSFGFGGGGDFGLRFSWFGFHLDISEIITGFIIKVIENSQTNSRR